MNICIYGASSNRLDPVYYEAAEQLGRCIAASGDVLVFGGGADGLMGACARGAKSRGGKILGIAPKIFDEPGFLLSDCDEFIMTSTMAERKEQMLCLSDAFIALPGGIGTMDEFFETITLKQLGLAKGPLVLLNTAGFYDPLVTFLDRMAGGGFMSEACLGLVHLCATPEEAVDAARLPEEARGSIRRLEDYTG